MRTLFFFLILSCAAPALIAQEADKQFSSLHALQGTWSMQTKRGIIYESWALKNDSVLLGKSFRTTPNGDTILLEEVSLVRKSGIVFYIPVVQGQNNGQPVSFKLVSTTNNIYIFDNPEHDFPQRVIYELPKNDSMHAWIEGLDKGSYRKSDFYYKRVN